jgi:integrase
LSGAQAADKQATYKEVAMLGLFQRGPIFRAVAREWWMKYMDGKMVTADAAWTRLERDALPYIGNMAVAKVDAPAVLALLRRMEDRGALEPAYKLKSTISQIMRYAIACGHAYANPARDLSFALTPKRNRPRPAITDPRAVGALMHGIVRYPMLATRCALRLLALTFVRPCELCRAEWAEVDLAEAVWRIPAERMKMRKAHVVPLSRQAAKILRTMHGLSGARIYVFPQARDPEKPMCRKRLNGALRSLGYSGDIMCAHGFRAMASTVLNEKGYNRDWIERQLAHSERSGVRASYNHAEYLAERRGMMQAWADYLDQLRRAAGRKASGPVASPCMTAH